MRTKKLLNFITFLTHLLSINTNAFFIHAADRNLQLHR